MTTSYTTNLRMPYFANNDTVDWSSIWQNQTQLFEYAISGVRPLTVTGGSTPLSTNNGADDDARYAVLAYTGTLTSNQIIIVPNSGKTYVVDNATSGSYTLSFKTASGSSYAVPQGCVQMIYCNGSASVYPVSPAVIRSTGVISPTSTGAAGSNGNLQYNTASALGGATAYNYAASGSLLTGTAQASTDIPLALVGAGSQSANLQEWRQSNGTVLASISSAGNVNTTGTLQASGAGSFLSTLSAATSVQSPLYIGGASAGSTATIKSTSGVGTTDAIIFQVGNNGATEAARFNTSGQMVGALGTVGAPAWAPTGGLTTGIYFPSTTSIGMSVSGSQVGLFGSTGLTAAAHIGGTAVGSTLTLQSTSGVGSTDAIIFKVGNNGATEAARFNTSGQYVSALGAVGTPSIAATGGLTTGLYFPSTSSVGVSIAGTQRALVDANGVTAATVIGGSAVGSTLTVKSTTAAGSTDAIIFQVGNNGATEPARFNTSGQTILKLGAAGTPTLVPTGVTNAGIWFPDTATTAISSGGSEVARVNATGLGIGLTPSNATLAIKAGTNSVAPILLTSGTNLTSAVAGGVEFDGVQFYATGNTTDGRGAIPNEQYFHLTANGSAISTTANFFGTTSNISLVASAYYLIDIEMFYTVTTGTQTVTWTLTNSVAPTAQNIYYEMSPVTGIVAPPGTATMLVGQAIADTTAARAYTTGALSAANHYARFRIWLQNSTGTNLKIQATSSANTITPLANSYWRARRVSPNNIGTFAA